MDSFGASGAQDLQQLQLTDGGGSALGARWAPGFEPGNGQAALEAIRPAAGTRPDPASFPKALADKLGKTEAEVKAALDALRTEGVVHGPGVGHGPDGDHHGGPGGPEFVTALAAKLGISTTDLQAALDSIKPAAGTEPDPAGFPKALADKLGKSEADVKAALDAIRPAGDRDGRGDRHGLRWPAGQAR
jgi:biotin operon repressor